MHIVYGDGTQEVSVDEENVTIRDGESVIVVSRAAFREIVLGWHRRLDQEREERDGA